MKRLFKVTGILMLAVFVQPCYSQSVKPKILKMDKEPADSASPFVNKTDEEWRKILPANLYNVARQKGTERPFTSNYELSKEVGTYYCAVCGNPLFRSDTKFESGCGWPSFYEPIGKSNIIYLNDATHGMVRTEVECGKCKSHLGHVFKDGPPPTGLRYCINGVVLDFQKAQDAQKKYSAGK